ncbi:hypothetical protein DRJ48_01580 [Candidatus Woesearchaeota archaeon]|nr:hypothetical protein [Candidatus Woesearchaeota archaeon]RLE43178.1 MAG: hypothetical protein DRJ48_01580 [Candidatus Woesearchaeota archaeon]
MRLYHGNNTTALDSIIQQKAPALFLEEHWFTQKFGYALMIAMRRAAEFGSKPAILVLDTDLLPRTSQVWSVEDGNSSYRITSQIPISQIELLALESVRKIPKLPTQGKHLLAFENIYTLQTGGGGRMAENQSISQPKMPESLDGMVGAQLQSPRRVYMVLPVREGTVVFREKKELMVHGALVFLDYATARTRAEMDWKLGGQPSVLEVKLTRDMPLEPSSHHGAVGVYRGTLKPEQVTYMYDHF